MAPRSLTLDSSKTFAGVLLSLKGKSAILLQPGVPSMLQDQNRVLS